MLRLHLLKFFLVILQWFFDFIIAIHFTAPFILLVIDELFLEFHLLFEVLVYVSQNGRVNSAYDI